MGNGKMGKSSSSGGSQITNAARRQLPGGKITKKGSRNAEGWKVS